MDIPADCVTSYDALPYDSHPYERTHPDNLATIARLFGMQPAEVETARVLELGCAAGGNLIPMAVALPRARFLGVDLSRRQLADGWKQIEALGLANIELVHRSILDVGAADGMFDYVVCHGVYSWVARDVQEQILEICRRNLAPQGVAYVSYNTNPGWFLRGMVRRMMCFHARQFDDPTTQVQQARALLDFLIGAGPVGDETYHALLRRELEIVRNRADSYLYHEHLEEDNEPLFFHEFIERAEGHGLRYLGEAQFSEMVPGNFSTEVEQTLRKLGAGLIHSEQYLDFLRNRTFRRTLLCHAGVELNRQLGAKQLGGLHVAAALEPISPAPDLVSAAGESFRSAGGHTVTVSHPLSKSALVRLGQLWPAGAPFEALPSLAAGGDGRVVVRDAQRLSRDVDELAGMVLELFAKDLVELRTRPFPPPPAAPPEPAASPLARLQAETGRHVTNLRHQTIELSDLARHLVRRLDGRTSRDRLLDSLEELVAEGGLVVEQNGATITDRGALTELLRAPLESELESLARQALLMPPSRSADATSER